MDHTWGTEDTYRRYCEDEELEGDELARAVKFEVVFNFAGSDPEALAGLGDEGLQEGLRFRGLSDVALCVKDIEDAGKLQGALQEIDREVWSEIRARQEKGRAKVNAPKPPCASRQPAGGSKRIIPRGRGRCGGKTVRVSGSRRVTSRSSSSSGSDPDPGGSSEPPGESPGGDFEQFVGVAL